MLHPTDDERRRFVGAAAMFLAVLHISGGVGHNLPQEAPQAFAQAIRDVEHL